MSIEKRTKAAKALEGKTIANALVKSHDPNCDVMIKFLKEVTFNTDVPTQKRIDHIEFVCPHTDINLPKVKGNTGPTYTVEVINKKTGNKQVNVGLSRSDVIETFNVDPVLLDD